MTSGVDPVFLAFARHGDLEGLRMSISASSVNTQSSYNGRTALHHAASCGHTPMAAFLISIGANCRIEDYRGMWPIDLALMTGPESLITLLEANTYSVAIDDLESTATNENPFEALANLGRLVAKRDGT